MKPYIISHMMMSVDGRIESVEHHQGFPAGKLNKVLSGKR